MQPSQRFHARTAPWVAALAVCCGTPPPQGLPTPSDRLSSSTTGPVRFVVLGDAGKANPGQHEVASGVRSTCAQRDDHRGPGCSFVLYLGDNIYNSGVDGVDDPQFASHFEVPYADLDLPFFVVLGNHDYGSTSLAGWRADPQLAYSAHSEKWTLPARHYDFTVNNVDFYALDTNAILLEAIWGDHGQGTWLDERLAGPRKRWRIAFGHHPYRSNGQHGNAGRYEGLDWLPLVNGSAVSSFFTEHICGKVDLYFSGHDHNRQWLSPSCRTHFVVSGAGATTTPLVNRDRNPTEWQDDETPGFLWVEVEDDILTAAFHDADGTERFVRAIARSGSTGHPAGGAMDASHSGMRRSSQ